MTTKWTAHRAVNVLDSRYRTADEVETEREAKRRLYALLQDSGFEHFGEDQFGHDRWVSRTQGRVHIGAGSGLPSHAEYIPQATVQARARRDAARTRFRFQERHY